MAGLIELLSLIGQHRRCPLGRHPKALPAAEREHERAFEGRQGCTGLRGAGEGYPRGREKSGFGPRGGW